MLKHAGICGVLGVCLEVRARVAVGGGALRSNSGILQPIADSFYIVAEQQFCTQKAPLIALTRRA